MKNSMTGVLHKRENYYTGNDNDDDDCCIVICGHNGGKKGVFNIMTKDGR